MSKSKNSQPLPFDRRGKKNGLVSIQMVLLKSDVYISLLAQSKVLMILLQMHWRNDKAVDYGVREAETKVPCAYNTARKAFNELQNKGFIVMVEPSYFSSRTQSKSRTWRLTWLPFKYEPPTNDWENFKL